MVAAAVSKAVAASASRCSTSGRSRRVVERPRARSPRPSPAGGRDRAPEPEAGPSRAGRSRSRAIYFSILQRKAIQTGDFADLHDLEERILAFQNRYNHSALRLEVHPRRPQPIPRTTQQRRHLPRRGLTPDELAECLLVRAAAPNRCYADAGRLRRGLTCRQGARPAVAGSQTVPTDPRPLEGVDCDVLTVLHHSLPDSPVSGGR